MQELVHFSTTNKTFRNRPTFCNIIFPIEVGTACYNCNIQRPICAFVQCKVWPRNVKAYLCQNSL